ncbi:MAG: preprotein translocase subunit SecE [Oscillospiraceae bacterium]|nr:preprotein translocase subunit SecE [Oscillospiraceae bacterium]
MFNKKNEIIDISNNPDTSTSSVEKKAAKKNKRPNVFKRIAKWFRELKSELKKIVWPGAKTVTKNTWVVLVCIVIVGVLLWVFDYLAGQGASALIHVFNK